MSKAFKCDRCGTLSEGVPSSTLSTDNTADGAPKDSSPYLLPEMYELCDHCCFAFKEWKGKIENRQEASE